MDEAARPSWICEDCGIEYFDKDYLFCYRCGRERPASPPTPEERIERLEQRIAELDTTLDTNKIHRMKLDTRLRFLEDEDHRA